MSQAWRPEGETAQLTLPQIMVFCVRFCCCHSQCYGKGSDRYHGPEFIGQIEIDLDDCYVEA